MKRFVLIVALLCCLSGCTTTYYNYRVDLVLPTGEVHKSWYVTGTSPPIRRRGWGGQTTLVRRGGGVISGIQAPTGWGLDITNEGKVETEQ